MNNALFEKKDYLKVYCTETSSLNHSCYTKLTNKVTYSLNTMTWSYRMQVLLVCNVTYMQLIFYSHVAKCSLRKKERGGEVVHVSDMMRSIIINLQQSFSKSNRIFYAKNTRFENKMPCMWDHREKNTSLLEYLKNE